MEIMLRIDRDTKIEDIHFINRLIRLVLIIQVSTTTIE
jgi:hypothetical protein